MTSPLDGRIRALAREEAAQAIQNASVPQTAAVDTQGIQQQITDLHEHTHHLATIIKKLEDRIDALEKTAQTPIEPTAEQVSTQRRTRRKPGDE